MNGVYFDHKRQDRADKVLRRARAKAGARPRVPSIARTACPLPLFPQLFGSKGRYRRQECRGCPFAASCFVTLKHVSAGILVGRGVLACHLHWHLLWSISQSIRGATLESQEPAECEWTIDTLPSDRHSGGCAFPGLLPSCSAPDIIADGALKLAVFPSSAVLVLF